MDKDKPPRIEDIEAAAARDGIHLAKERAPFVLEGTRFLHDAARRNERLIAETEGADEP
ncbi:MAG: hypothetical protein J0I23_20175 [Rhizobiales bacterium]|nr:hypothetical protein [Hyphomicrobiales bacterium]